jgi:ATP-dependent RNA helicase MSS116, mitochondrial
MIQEDPRLARRSAAYRATSQDIRGIILSPTRELAEQIYVEARKLAKHTGLVIQLAVGGTNKREMLRRTQREGCHLMIATPGRLNDLLQDNYSRIAAPNLAAMVLDEADRMLDVGFSQELEQINRYLPDPAEKTRQTLMFSATVPKEVIRLARSMVRVDDFEFVQTIAPDDDLTHQKVPQRIIPVDGWSNVLPSLLELIDRETAKAKENPDSPPFKAMVFFHTTALVRLAEEVVALTSRKRSPGFAYYTIHSKLTQKQRTYAANSFRRAQSGVLLSSDVTARGLDFPNVTHVIQIGAPPDTEQYIHRLGRTGRQDKFGEGYLIVPQHMMPETRSRLGNLPIEPDRTVASADFQPNKDPEGSNVPAHFEEVKSALRSADRELLTLSYLAMFGQISGSAQQLADSLHSWVRDVWGWERPPALSPKTANLRGLGRIRGMNIGYNDEVENSRGGHHRDGPRDGLRDGPPDEFRDNSRDSFRGGSRGGPRDGPRDGFRGRTRVNRDRDSDSQDPWNRMSRDRQTEAPRRRSFSRKSNW